MKRSGRGYSPARSRWGGLRGRRMRSGGGGKEADEPKPARLLGRPSDDAAKKETATIPEPADHDDLRSAVGGGLRSAAPTEAEGRGGEAPAEPSPARGREKGNTAATGGSEERRGKGSGRREAKPPEECVGRRTAARRPQRNARSGKRADGRREATPATAAPRRA